MGLNTRPLGTSGMNITTVGFGAWAVGGGGWAFGWGPQDDTASVASIRHAVALGVNWIDTAAVYGLGHSEEIVGRALREIPSGDRPFVFTKAGLLFDRENPFETPKRVSKPETLRKEVELSLRRLGVERIDLYQFHQPDESGTPVEESWGAMARLADEGKVRAIGVSNYDVSMLERCERVRHVDSLQPPFSLIRRDTAQELIPWCAAHGTGVIAYSPMQSGILTDSFTAERVAKFATDDWRKRAPYFQQPALTHNLQLRDALRPIAKRHNTTVSSISAAWTLAWPGLSGAIVGARSAAQVDGWIDAGRIELTLQDLDEIASAIERSQAGSGPIRPSRASASANR